MTKHRGGRPKYRLYRDGQEVDRQTYIVMFKKLSARCAELSLQAPDVLYDLMLNGKSEAIRERAASTLMDRGYGLPTQQINIHAETEVKHSYSDQLQRV